MATFDDVVLNMKRYLVLDIFWYIVNIAKEYHITLGIEKWKKNMINIKIEYDKTYSRAKYTSPLDRKGIVCAYISRTNGMNPEDFDHDYSCRDFNHRLLFVDAEEFSYDENYENFRNTGHHFPPLMIANIIKNKSTFLPLPKNY